MIVWHFGKQILQILVNIQIIGPGTLCQGIQYPVCKCSPRGICKQPGASCCCKWFYVCFTIIIAQGNASILKERFQVSSLILTVPQCLGEFLIYCMHCRSPFHPRPKGIKNRLRCLLTLLFLLFIRKIFNLSFNFEEQIDIFSSYTVNYPYCSNFKPPFPAARF